MSQPWFNRLVNLARRLVVVSGADLASDDTFHSIDSREDPEAARRLLVDSAGRYVDADGVALTTGTGLVNMYVPRTRTIVCGALGGSLTFRPRRVPVRLDGGPAAALDVRATGSDREWTVTVEAIPGITTLGAIAAAFTASQAPGGVAGTVQPDALVECTASDPLDLYDGSLFSGALKSLRPAPIIVPGELDADGQFVPSTRDSTLETVYQSPADVALAAGVNTAITPYVAVEAFDVLAYYVANTGANPITGLVAFYSDGPTGVSGMGGGLSQAANSSAPTLAAAAILYGMSQPQSATRWTNADEVRVRFRGFRMSATSAVGSAARVMILGRRAK